MATAFTAAAAAAAAALQPLLVSVRGSNSTRDVAAALQLETLLPLLQGGPARVLAIQVLWGEHDLKCAHKAMRERFYCLYQTRRVSRAEPNKKP